MASASANNRLADLSRDLLEVLDALGGPHPGYRPAHAKGIMFSGVYRPSPSAISLTRAPHVKRPSTPVTVRFSDATGNPAVPDNDASSASPRGCAIRYHLAEHVHTDIIAHSANGFPVRTPEEFLEFLHARASSGPGASHPTPIESFVARHPETVRYIQTPKPIPTSFARESYYAPNAYRFTNDGGLSVYGRFRVIPAAGAEYLDDAAAARKGPNFLFEEIAERVSKGAVTLRIVVQVADQGDVVDDATARWPENRTQIDFGSVEITGQIPATDSAAARIIYDPIPRVDGIDPSDDPLLEVRSEVYLMSGRRRRTATQR